MTSAFCSVWRLFQMTLLQRVGWARPCRGHGLFAACCTALVASLTSSAFAQTPSPAPQARVTIGYVDIAGDPRHEPIKAYERIVLKPRESPVAGAQVGIDEAQALSRVLKMDFALERITVKSAEEVAPAVTQALTDRGIHFFIV